MWILLTVLIALLTWSYPRWRRNIAIKRWQRALNLDAHEKAYNQLFNHLNGFTLSRQARINNDAMEYVYGEIDFISFIALLSCTRPTANTVFYDLGSGIGTAVIACAMVFNVKKSCGIELFSELHTTALLQQQRLAQTLDYNGAAKTVSFIHSNFLEVTFDDATLIFINATAFFGETWTTLNQRLEQLAPGIQIITTSKRLIAPSYSVLHQAPVKMSWGFVNAYIHEKHRDIPY